MSDTTAHTTLAELPGLVGSDLGPTAWRTVPQQMVDAFADLTDDHNPIHVDPAFAVKTPFGGTIAHGFLTLSLLASLLGELMHVDGVSMSVNYGFEKIRFPAPVPVGSQIRAAAHLVGVDEIPGGMQVRLQASIEVKDQAKPAVAAEWLVRHYG